MSGSDAKPGELHIPAGFPAAEIDELRKELLSHGLDFWQAGELIRSFLTARGYGISTGEARKAATVIEAGSCSVECIQQELGKLALVM